MCALFGENYDKPVVIRSAKRVMHGARRSLVLVSSGLLLCSQIERLATLDGELSLLLANLALHTKNDLLRGFGLCVRNNRQNT